MFELSETTSETDDEISEFETFFTEYMATHARYVFFGSTKPTYESRARPAKPEFSSRRLRYPSTELFGIMVDN